jgi:hypothetical protein
MTPFTSAFLSCSSTPNARAVAAMPDEDDDNVTSFPPTRLLRLDQTTFCGVLHSCAVEVEDEKRQLILGIDFLQDLLEEDKTLIGVLTSIMTCHACTRHQQIEACPGKTFYVVKMERSWSRVEMLRDVPRTLIFENPRIDFRKPVRQF